MCKFFSCVSNGEGVVKFFDIKDIVEQMAIGNPKTYSWNSHTSICQFHGIKSKEEDLWNKWEYDPFKKTLEPDSRPLGVKDDSPQVKEFLVKYFEGKDIEYLQNLYNRNSGNRNSGNWNSGDRNSGHWNSGHCNSGNCNSGNCNSGDRNSGDRNSGNWNSGHCNSGHWNSGDGVINSLCTKQHFMLFDKPCTEEEWRKSLGLPYDWFELNVWVSGGDMTEEEKAKHTYWQVTGGYLKTVPYKEAWKKCPKEFIEKVKKLKGFTKAKFKEISGLDA